MFRAILLPRQSEIPSLLSSKNTIYLPSNKYVLYALEDEEIPISIRNQLIPMIIDTKLSEPIHRYQHIYFDQTDLDSADVQRTLIGIRSRLTYFIHEMLAPDDIYIELNNQIDDKLQKRPYRYHLNYQDIPCYILNTDPLLQQMNEIAFVGLPVYGKVGPLLASTHSIVSVGSAPRWFINETIRDIVELGELDMTNKVMIIGPETKDLYIFNQKEVNLSDDIMEDFIDELRGQIVANIQLKIFPRATPQEFILSRQLKSIPNGRWTLQYDVPNWALSHIFEETLQTTFSLPSLDDLFWVLSWLLTLPTYPFIEKELQVFVEQNGPKIVHSTKYFPDYIRLNLIGRYRTNDRNVKLTYAGAQVEKGKAGLYFYDWSNNQTGTLLNDAIKIPEIQRTFPGNFSLETRIKVDFISTS